MIESDLDKRLTALEELTKDNNNILHGIRRSARIGRALFLLKWLIIIAISMVGYYYIQPYIDSLLKTYQTVSRGINDLKQASSKIPGFGQ